MNPEQPRGQQPHTGRSRKLSPKLRTKLSPTLSPTRTTKPHDSDSPASAPPQAGKADATRARILDAALELLEERGYAATTMRAIAERAGVAAGNAYYYFDGKEALIQGFYLRTHEEHLERALPAIAAAKGFKARLLALMETKLETMERYHEFAGVLFKSAADPSSPLNPFSESSRPVRTEATRLFETVLEGARLKPPADLAAELPDLLWTWHMGVVLFWVHDASPGRRRTRRLLTASVDIISKLVSLSSLPLMGPLRRSALALLRDLKADG